MLIATNNLSRQSLVQRVKDIAQQPHPMSSEIRGEAVLLEGQLERFEGTNVGEIRDSASLLRQSEISKSELHRNASRAYGAGSLLSAAAGMVGMYTGNAVLTVAGVTGFVAAGVGAVVYDHTSALYSDAAKHTEASVARLDRWAGFVASQG